MTLGLCAGREHANRKDPAGIQTCGTFCCEVQALTTAQGSRASYTERNELVVLKREKLSEETSAQPEQNELFLVIIQQL